MKTTEEKLKDLSLGTRFRVINGDWYGRVCGSTNNKKVFIEYNQKTYNITDSLNHLEIEVVKD